MSLQKLYRIIRDDGAFVSESALGYDFAWAYTGADVWDTEESAYEAVDLITAELGYAPGRLKLAPFEREEPTDAQANNLSPRAHLSENEDVDEEILLAESDARNLDRQQYELTAGAIDAAIYFVAQFGMPRRVLESLQESARELHKVKP